VHPARSKRPFRWLVAAASLALVTATAGCFSDPDSSDADVKGGSLAETTTLDGVSLTVGSKEFTEQLIMCKITSLALRSVGATVTEQCGIQGSNATRAALTSGNIDMYWEYTGTAWINHLQHTDPINDPVAQYDAVAEEDLSKHEIKWLPMAPANNTYAIMVKTSTSEQLGIRTLSEYAALANTDPAKASFCVGNEFASRNDGFPGLQAAYGFTISKPHVATLADGAIFNAVANDNPCTFGVGTATDGRVKALDLTILTDDKQFFPVYNPAPTVRKSVYDQHPDIEKVLKPIAEALTDSVLQELNGQVDIDGKEPAEVAEEWLRSKGYIGA